MLIDSSEKQKMLNHIQHLIELTNCNKLNWNLRMRIYEGRVKGDYARTYHLFNTTCWFRPWSRLWVEGSGLYTYTNIYDGRKLQELTEAIQNQKKQYRNSIKNATLSFMERVETLKCQEE